MLISFQGPRSNFEIGGGGGGRGRGGAAPLVTQYWEDTRHFFLLTLYNLKILGGHVLPRPPCSAVPAFLSSNLYEFFFQTILYTAGFIFQSKSLQSFFPRYKTLQKPTPKRQENRRMILSNFPLNFS